MSAGQIALLAAGLTASATIVGRRGRVAPWLLALIVVCGAAATTVLVAAAGGDSGGFALALATEAALSLDTVVALVLVFSYFAVPETARSRLLGWALAGCAALRIASVAAGVQLLERLDWVAYPLAGLLLASTLALTRTGPGSVEERPPGQNRVLALAARLVPLTNRYEGASLRVDTASGRHWTPLAVVAASVAAIAGVLALDGLAVVGAATDDAGLAVTATVLAVVALRELYAVAQRHLETIFHLKAAMSVLLMFAAVRLLARGPEEPQLAPALATIAVALFVGLVARLGRDHAADDHRPARSAS